MGTGVRTTAAVAIGLAGLGFGAAGAHACPDADALAGSLTAKRYEAAITCLVNETRRAGAAGAVQSESRLRRAAARHNRSMVSGSFFSHRDPGGRDPADRAEAAGYTRGAKRWVVSENIAWASGDQSSPNAVVATWILSPSHRETMMNPGFRDFGIAVTMDAPASTTLQSSVTVTTEYGFRSG